MNISISLTPELVGMIKAKVESGRYTSTSEVIREAIRIMDQRDQLARLRSELAIGDAQIERGEVSEWTDTSMQEILAEADEEDRLGLPIPDHVRP